ncbi:MAG: DUF481 domain-containing protein [Myxococcota bacterium]
MWSCMFALSSLAHAEDSTFTGTAEAPTEEAPATETHVTGELGGTVASGNSNFYTVNGLVSASHKFGRNQLSLVAGLNLGGAKPLPVVATTTGGATETLPPADPDKYVQNVQRLYADGRYDRFLTDHDALYVLAGAFRDRFAGYDLRTHEQIGYSRLLVDGEAATLRAELGLDWAQEDYTGDVDPGYADILAARVLLGGSYAFDDRASVADTVEVYENLLDPADVRVLNTASVTATLSGKLSLKVSHALIFDNVPVEGFEPLDQTTMVTLVASLL